MAGMVMLDLSCVHCEDMDWNPHLQNIPPHISASQCDEVSRIHFPENQEEAGVNFGDSPLWITSVQPLRPKVEEDLGFVSAKQGRGRGGHGCHILAHVPGSDILGGASLENEISCLHTSKEEHLGAQTLMSCYVQPGLFLCVKKIYL